MTEQNSTPAPPSVAPNPPSRSSIPTRTPTLAAFTLTAAVVITSLSGCAAIDRAADGAANIDNASATVCQTDRQTLETAVEAYWALFGQAPANEAALVPDILRAEIATYDLAADGTAVPAPGSGC